MAKAAAASSWEQKVYKSPPQRRIFAHLIPPRQFQPHIVQSKCLGLFCSAFGQAKMLCCFRQRMLHIIVKAKTVTQISLLSILDHINARQMGNDPHHSSADLLRGDLLEWRILPLFQLSVYFLRSLCGKFSGGRQITSGFFLYRLHRSYKRAPNRGQIRLIYRALQLLNSMLSEHPMRIASSACVTLWDFIKSCMRSRILPGRYTHSLFMRCALLIIVQYNAYCRYFRYISSSVLPSLLFHSIHPFVLPPSTNIAAELGEVNGTETFRICLPCLQMMFPF